MVVDVNLKNGKRIKYAKVINIALLNDQRLCLQRKDKRLKDRFREELIPISEVKSFYQH